MSSIVIPFIGGLAMFIYGMNIMADGLQHAAGSKMKKILEVLTQNKLMGIALGALVTAIIQSSSATTVMVVGFVNAGLMNLTQAISVIMGANIGTTITGWLVSAGEWAKMFSPSTLAPIAVMVGVIVTLVGKRQQSKDVAGIIIGFGILFIGMNTMSDAVYPLRESEVFKTAFISMGSNPFLGILVGAGVTAIIQSSSASQGILLSLASAGLVPTNAAVFIIMGQNIGTCVTAILSSVGASKNAKCVGTMHLTFNIAGTIIFSILAMFLFARLDPSYGEGIINMTQISFIHTVFNVGTTIILMPFSGYIIKFAMKVNGLKAVETKSDEAELVHLDKRMMSTPSVAVEGAKLETIRMGRIARENLSLALSTLSDHDEEKMADVKQREFVIDKLCDNISKYLIDLCMLHLSDKDNEMVTSLLNTVSDMERVGDHAENIVELAEEMKQEGISFSDTALEELNEMSTTTLGAYDNAVKALELDDITYAVKTSFLEDQVDAMEKKLRAGHIERLSNAECSVNAGIHFIDLLGNLERVSDHAMNIAQVVLNEHRAEKNFHEEKNVE
ncbi:Na/Pi cotransporter family protein [Anaerotignum faecicola]|nr:Na/Pi cotransporter family protein [Anaerotignum faecicola]MBE5722216.1 Na/Pi cotransporter family protein [Clostridium sp.]HBD87882.1 Na/Pi cotransporter [Tyzzerella sp.]